jgi:hypothetical protein
MTRQLVLRVAMVLLAPAPLFAQSAVEIYQRALVQDQAAGNLAEAIALYRRAAAEAGADRGLAATALVRAAAAEEKLGDPRAVDTYTQVLRTYTEQREQVGVAQARLASLRPVPASAQDGAAGAARVELATVDAVLETYCTGCHNPRQKTANLDLQTARVQGLTANPALGERALQRLRARRDPPIGMKRPDEGTYQTMVETLATALDQSYPASDSSNPAAQLDDMGLATRMARFIWGAEKPDASLTDAARRGALRNAAVLEQQVRRMLRDVKSDALVSGFFERWLLRDGLDKLATSTQRSPGLDDELRQAFATETRLFLRSQLREDRDAADLWTANYTFVNERLARHYGILRFSGSGFRRVSLTDPARGGLLGQGSLLTVTSYADRTSPAVRGKFVMRLFYGLNPPDPPPNVPALGGANDRPMKERMTEAASSPACVSCHQSFVPMGFALDNFDQIGAWRTSQAGSLIDGTGTFPDGTTFNGPVELREGLLRTRDAYYTSITRSLLGYALGREGPAWRTYEYEMPAVRAVVRDAAASDYRWSAIVLGIVQSQPFQTKNVVP